MRHKERSGLLWLVEIHSNKLDGVEMEENYPVPIKTDGAELQEVIRPEMSPNKQKVKSLKKKMWFHMLIIMPCHSI